MARIFSWIVDHSRFSALLAIGVVLVLSTGIPRLEIDGSIRALFPDSGEAFEDQREFSVNFRGEPNVIVVVRSDDILQPEILRYIKQTGDEIALIENVRGVRNLFTTQIAKPDGSGFRLGPLVEEIPKNAKDAEELRAAIFSTPLSRNILVNKDGSAATIQARLAYRNAPKGFEEDVVKSIRSIIDSTKRPPQVSDVYVTGGPVIATTITRHIWRDMLLLGPVALLLIALTSFLSYRRAIAPLLIFSTGSLSVLATLGFMGHAGISINPIVSVVVILILVVGCTEDLHILAEFFLGVSRRPDKKEALRALSNTIVHALVLTSASTALGFLTLLGSPVPGLRDFAITCATGVILNFLVTILISPAILRFGRTIGPISEVEKSGKDHFLTAPVHALSLKPAVGGTAAFLSLVIAGMGISRLEINNDYLRFFSERSSVRQDHSRLVEDFGGSASLVVIVETGQQKGVFDQEFMKPVAAFHDELAEEFPSVFGITDLLRQFHRYNDPDDTESDLPSKETDIADFRMFFGRNYLRNCVDFDGSRTAIWIRVPSEGSFEIRSFQETISQLAAGTLPPETEVKIVGQPVMTAYVSDLITRELIWNLFFLATAVGLILTLFFRSARTGLLALVPNLFPVLITFGFMGWVHIPLSTGTFAVAIVALGISVDDTIHLVTRFSHERICRPGASFRAVLLHTLQKEMIPITSTSIILTVGFAPLFFSDFQVHRETGLLFIVAILSALLADLIVTPIILRWHPSKLAVEK